MKLPISSILSLLFVLAATPMVAGAIGIGVTPGTIDILENELTYAILVHNTDDEAAIYTARFDELYRGAIISPEKFTIEAGEVQRVMILFRKPPEQDGAVLITVADRNAQALSASGGIRVEINALPDESLLAYARQEHIALALIGLGLVLLGASFGLNARRRSVKT